LIFGSDGNLYGTAADGGASGTGTVFTVTTSGGFTTLYSFALASDGTSVGDGATPMGALMEVSSGNFYGTTQNGGGSTNAGHHLQACNQQHQHATASVAISLNPVSITAGDSSTLTWLTTNAPAAPPAAHGPATRPPAAAAFRSPRLRLVHIPTRSPAPVPADRETRPQRLRHRGNAADCNPERVADVHYRRSSAVLSWSSTGANSCTASSSPSDPPGTARS